MPVFEWSANGREFHIREAESEADYHTVEDIQKEVWGFSDLDIVPLATLIATQHAGGMLLCAFENERMIGFAYGFPAFEHGRASIHSHMLAVREDCRNFHAGSYLKLAQRESTLEKGLDQITWTFDPLQSLNAHLNIAKLGVISRRYIVNFYGETSSSPLHQGFGTDRLWVTWEIASDRVNQRIDRDERPPQPDPSDYAAPALVQSKAGRPVLADLSRLSGNSCLIEIPSNITSLKQRDPAAAIAWREATRAAFTAAIEAGFTVKEFFRLSEGDVTRSFYWISR